MNKAAKILLILMLSLLASCFHYVNYSFNKTSAPDKNPDSVGEILILKPRINTDLDDDAADELISEDVIGTAADILDELKFPHKNGELGFTVSMENRKKMDMTWEDITVENDQAKGKYLFTLLDFSTTRIAGYVYKRVYDPTFNSYYYREVFEEKMVFNIRVQIFLHDFDKKETVFEKSFSNSEEFSKDTPPVEEYIMKLYGDYLKSSFEEFRPKKYKVKRYLIGY
ncbi:hypothetical protein KAU32_07760 [bacterium]|nr:hypothetical protein [bacterium]